MHFDDDHDQIRLPRTLAARARQHPTLVLTGAILLGAAALAVTVVAVRSYQEHAQYSALLDALQADYQAHAWDSSTGRTVDRQNGGITTSEGQGYSLLRAVWRNDRAGFDATWRWTAANLQRKDGLFGWRYDDAGADSASLSAKENTASDADTDIALSLLMAGKRWHDDSYTLAAQRIIAAVWDHEVLTVRGQPYLMADNLEKTASTRTVVINPSYLSPYAYRAFAAVDADHPWMELVHSSYTLLQAASSAPLDSQVSADLPPDWVLMDRNTGSLLPPTAPNQSTDFGFNAIRTLWRIGLDYQWNHDGEAKATLEKFGLLQREWQQNKLLYAVYQHNGRAKANYASLALYGTSLGYWKATHPATMDAILRDKLLPLMDSQNHTLKSSLSYYDNNWVWFGAALAANKLPNVAPGGGHA